MKAPDENKPEALTTKEQRRRIKEAKIARRYAAKIKAGKNVARYY